MKLNDLVEAERNPNEVLLTQAMEKISKKHSCTAKLNNWVGNSCGFPDYDVTGTYENLISFIQELRKEKRENAVQELKNQGINHNPIGRMLSDETPAGAALIGRLAKLVDKKFTATISTIGTRPIRLAT